LCAIMRQQIGQRKEPGDLVEQQMVLPIVPAGLVERLMAQPTAQEDLVMPAVLDGLAAVASVVAGAKV